MAAGGAQQRLGAGGQQEPVLVRRLEPGFRGQGLVGRKEGGIGRGDFRRDERDQRAAVVQGNQHAALPCLGQVGHQRGIVRREEGLEHADGVRQDAPRLRAAVETEHRGRVGRDGPQERIFGIDRRLPGLVLPVQAGHRPRDAREHQRDRDDRYDCAFPVHFQPPARTAPDYAKLINISEYLVNIPKNALEISTEPVDNFLWKNLENYG